MQKPFATLLTLLSGVSLLAACSSDGSGLLSASTSSISTSSTTQTAQAAKADPACVALSQRIDTLRKEGVIDRAEKASVGKTTTVAVKRASLAQIAELDKANAEFQARCSTLGVKPVQTQAQVVPVTPVPSTSAQPNKTAAAVAPPVVQTPKQ